MLKKDVLKILTNQEIAKVIDKHPAQATRMARIVPVEYESKLLTACGNKVRKITEALNKISDIRKP